MPKKDKHVIRKVVVGSLLALNIFFAAAFLFSFLAHYISPEHSVLVAYCGLAFPYLMFINLFFTVMWIFIRYRYLFISLTLLLLNVNNIDKYYQLRGTEKPEKCENCIKVMNYNAKLFGVYNSNDKQQREKDRDQILRFLQEERPDIVCFQEYFYDKSGKLEFNTTDSLLSVLRLNKRTPKETKNYYSHYFPTNLKDEYYYGVAIFSRYKIVNTDFITLPDSNTTNGALFADIKYKNDTIRIYSLHLESFHMDPMDYETGRMILQRDIQDPDFNKNARKLSRKMNVAFRKRAAQANVIRAHMDSCRYPVIVCGDFNDTPASYVTHKIGKGLSDTFRTGGSGEAVTYIGDAFPSYRIDYIFHDKKFSSYGHTVAEQLTVSDHYPIYSYISIKKR